MIEDLRGRGALNTETDVVIVGAGFAGLFAAVRLTELGFRVIVLEAGPAVGKGESASLEPVRFVRNTLGSGDVGRAAGIGGTSSLWGGALLPMVAADLEVDALDWGIRWPVQLSELEPFGRDVERRFGLPNDSYVDEELSTDDLLVRLPKWPAFGRRNIARLLEKEIASPTGFACWANATATRIEPVPGGGVTVEARADDGSSLSLRARKVIIAAGVVESTRLLLNADRLSDGRILESCEAAGKYLHDHLATHAAVLEPSDRNFLTRLSAFRFQANAMRSVRFEPTAAARNQHGLGAGIGHILFTTEGDGSFDALRDIYRGFQRRQMPGLGQIGRVARDAPWFARAIYERFVNRRLLPPHRANFVLNLIVEQRPLAHNRVFLSDERDRFGNFKALVDWAPSAEDQANFERMTDFCLAAWRSTGFDRAGRLLRRTEAAEEIGRSPGTIHAGGTLRMATQKSEGVVDSRLRLFNCPDICVASTAVFPRTGGANPTFTLLALALRLAEDLANELGERRLH